MGDIYFEKLYRYDRINEPVGLAIPVKKGELFNDRNVVIMQNGKKVLSQSKVTSRYEDGSIRYLYVDFLANLPANKSEILHYELNEELKLDENNKINQGIEIKKTENGFFVNTQGIIFTVIDHGKSLFEMIDDGNVIYEREQFAGPLLETKDGKKYEMQIGKWKLIDAGPVKTILTVKGSNISDNNKKTDFEIRITAYVGKSWLEIGYRIINTTDDDLEIKSLNFYIKADKNKMPDDDVKAVTNILDGATDSTGCGDIRTDNSKNEGPVFHTRGITELDLIEEKAPVNTVRTLTGNSNYKTDFLIGKDATTVAKYIDAKYLLKEANEHFSETLYGTFMADRTDENGGICATIYQAFQNYPKAVLADKNGITVMLVPTGVGNVVMKSGMAREQQFLLHFHNSDMKIIEIDNRSLIYQMPDRPVLAPKVYKDAGVMLDVFPEKLDDDVEIELMGRADSHSRCFGMLNWGDSWDGGYTAQGRGNGKIVYSNNEYDYPHSCALQYARTGVRRFLDYLLVSAKHWMDVDVCHYSSNPLNIGGQWEHTAGHCNNGVMVCSHEWVEGLLDYYHFSGDERGLKTALGIGENVLKLLDTPMYAHAGEANARETGWALRTLTALYVETNDKKWLKKCDWILDSFKLWEQQYGSWLAPYTDNTVIRVGFMISVAVGSVMRYYRVFPRKDLKDMMIRAVDDLVENCMLDNGLFYYKELPSLSRTGNNTLLLEALTIAYELTKDTSYLYKGLKTFNYTIGKGVKSYGGSKREEDDAVLYPGGCTKSFAQSFIPIITYYKAISDNDIKYN